MINNQNHLATKFIIFLHIIATNSCIQKLWRLSTHGIHSIESAICTLAFSLFASMHFSHVAVRKNYFESASEIGLLSKELPIKVSARIKAAEDWQQIKHSAPLGWWQKQIEREREREPFQPHTFNSRRRRHGCAAAATCAFYSCVYIYWRCPEQ